MELFSKTQLIKKESYEIYRNYKYNGKDDSIFYRFVASPLCDIIVNFIPEWLA
jgi:hypothetical protein